jgi:hypothetical protein
MIFSTLFDILKFSLPLKTHDLQIPISLAKKNSLFGFPRRPVYFKVFSKNRSAMLSEVPRQIFEKKSPMAVCIKITLTVH